MIAGYPTTLIPSYGKTVNTYLPVELLREIFLYSVESNQMKPSHLASVCRHWRSVITRISYLWSTLRVGTWTEMEEVTTWLQRAHPKRVVIDIRQDDRGSSHTPSFATLQEALATTSQWHVLTISSFPSESIASPLSFQVALPMDVLRILYVRAGCVHSPSITHLLDLVPTEALLSELRLPSPFASAHFLQPRWLPVFKNLSVLIVNGRDIHESFDLLPAFTRLHTFEADRLPLPSYELNTNLPFLHTLQKLHLRASSVQWMAGRIFPCLEECAILLPRLWEAVRQHEVELPSCRKFTYHGYPTTTSQYFHVSQMRAMELRSHDCKEQRVSQQLRNLCTVDGRISKLITLHLTLQCSEQVLVKMLRYLGPLQELFLSIAHPSHSWKRFLRSLAAKPSRNDWPDWSWAVDGGLNWEQWCSSQTWHANILPHLKYLGMQFRKRSSHSEYLDNSLLFRLVGWSRAQLTPPLEQLKVWERRGIPDDIMVNYISNGYLGVENDKHDTTIIRGMITRRLVIDRDVFTRISQLHSTDLFRQLQGLDVSFLYRDDEITFLPFLKQIKWLHIKGVNRIECPSGIDLPLAHTLQSLDLRDSALSWMLGMTFKALEELHLYHNRSSTLANLSRDEGLQIDLPACTLLELVGLSTNHLHIFSCTNVQSLQWLQYYSLAPDIHQAVVRSLRDFLCNAPFLQRLEMRIEWCSEIYPLVQFLFCGAREEGAWRDIRSVEVDIGVADLSRIEASSFFDQIVGHQQHYEKWWKEFRVAKDFDSLNSPVKVSASM